MSAATGGHSDHLHITARRLDHCSPSSSALRFRPCFDELPVLVITGCPDSGSRLPQVLTGTIKIAQFPIALAHVELLEVEIT